MPTRKASPADGIRVWAILESSLLRLPMMVSLMAFTISLLSQTLKLTQLASPRPTQLVSMADRKRVWAVLEASARMLMQLASLANGKQVWAVLLAPIPKPTQLALPRSTQLVPMANRKQVWAVLEASAHMLMQLASLANGKRVWAILLAPILKPMQLALPIPLI